MARIPDRFDLWIRKARESTDPARQVDWVLGALVARDELYFLNLGTKEQPRIARAQGTEAGASGDEHAVVFTDAGRFEDFAAKQPDLGAKSGHELPAIVSPTAAALDWCVANTAGLLINPGEGDAVMISPVALAAFVEEWKERGGRQGAGFWIPNMTTEEEDFWQENGL